MNLNNSEISNYKLVLTSSEREEVRILVVEPNNNLRSSLRNMLMQIGFNNIASVKDYSKAISKLNDETYTHLIFDVNNHHLPPKEFLITVHNIAPDLIAIPASESPTVDNVFDLLLAGSSSYIVKPFNTNALSDSISFATKGEPITKHIGGAKDRNEALVKMVFSALNKLALVLKQSRRFATARREVPRKARAFKHAIKMAHQFSDGSPNDFRDLIVDYLVEKANNQQNDENMPKTRKRARKRARRKKERTEDDD